MNLALDHHLCRISADGSETVVAFFDLDQTLIDGYSLSALAWQQFFNGRIGLKRVWQLSRMFIRYARGRIDYEQMLQATVDGIAGMQEADLVQLGRQAFANKLSKRVYREGRALVSTHFNCGHDVVMLTSATRYQADPIAQALDIVNVHATELEIVDGRVTGKVVPCYGIGKLRAAEAYVAGIGARLDNAYFYSDAYDDLPLLEAVGKPVVVNGKSRIVDVCECRGWPHFDFSAV
jgi:putative phosphoserine phosphatase/1-acylglycerol-3-phosphate O-acyltransferase